jgi:hypothetical protein
MSPSSEPAYAGIVAGSVVGRLVQRLDSTELWVEVTGEEDREVRIAITTESARRLVAVLDSLLAMSSS